MNARIPVHIDASAEGCAARTARIEAAVTARLVRGQKLSDARALVRSAKLMTPWELLAAIQNTQSCIVAAGGSVMAEYAEKLGELAADLDTEINETPPELAELPYSGRRESEYDTYTQGVRNRGYA